MEITPEPKHRPIRMNVPLPLNWWEKIWDSKQEFLDASRGLRYPMMRTLIREDNGQVYPYAFVKGIEDEDLDRFPKDGVTPQFRIKNEDVLIGNEYKRKELFQVEYPGSDKETETLVDLAAYRNPTKEELDFRIRSIADTAIPSVVGGQLEMLQNNINNVNSSLTSKIDSDIAFLRETLNNKISILTQKVNELIGIEPTLDTFTDWFLPSLGELLLIYSNLVDGMEPLLPQEGMYWSSSESTAELAHVVNFDGGTTTADGKLKSLRVLPVRSFVSADTFSLRENGQAPDTKIFHSIDNGNGTFRYFETYMRPIGSLQWFPLGGGLEIIGTGTTVNRGTRNTSDIVKYLILSVEAELVVRFEAQNTAAAMCNDLVIDMQGGVSFKNTIN